MGAAKLRLSAQHSGWGVGGEGGGAGASYLIKPPSRLPEPSAGRRQQSKISSDDSGIVLKCSRCIYYFFNRLLVQGGEVSGTSMRNNFPKMDAKRGRSIAPLGAAGGCQVDK